MEQKYDPISMTECSFSVMVPMQSLIHELVCCVMYHILTHVLFKFSQIYSKLGSHHFLGGGGDRLFVIAGRQFFLVPPFACVKKYWSPPLTMGKNTGPPLAYKRTPPSHA